MRLIQLITIYFLTASTGVFAQLENPVSWKSVVENKGNAVYQIQLDAQIDDPWHMYAMKLEKDGPIPTAFSVKKGTGYELLGELKELTKPLIKFDKGFRFNVGLYAKEASFLQEVRVLTEKGAKVTIYVEYQCCNDEICLPPFTDSFLVDLPGLEASPLQPLTALTQNTEVRDEKTVSSNDETNITTSKVTINEDGGSSSLFMFFLIAFIAGLAAILTPCVFPMIPMTVSFFMKGSENRSKAVLKGLIFGLSMILVYTGTGALVSLTGMNADVGNVLSTHWIPNLIFFLLFMVFAASFLGLFEIVLPSGIINRSDRQADKGGFAGAFFMGVTTVHVSFSCTGPIIGSLLIEAAGGQVLKPILGMFFFSLAFALPFTLLAIFPSMLSNLPKSGGWLNSVKVVLGFIVFAFGMKFLSNIDQSYHLGIFSREVYLAIWFVLSVLLGFYLIGKIKFSGDTDVQFISVPRLILTLSSFTFAVYLFTGILGADLNNIASLIPPKSSQNFSIVASKSHSGQVMSDANWCGPGRYDDIFKLPNGLKGYFNLEDGIRCAKEKQKPVFLDFTGHSCSNCKQMENLVWPDPEVLSKLSEEYVIISLYTDDRTRLPEENWITRPDGKALKTIGEINKHYQMDKFNSITTPLYVLMDSDGNILSAPKAKDLNIKSYSAFLQSGLDEFRKRK